MIVFFFQFELEEIIIFSFMRRHRELSVRKAHCISRARIDGYLNLKV